MKDEKEFMNCRYEVKYRKYSRFGEKLFSNLMYMYIFQERYMAFEKAAYS